MPKQYNFISLKRQRSSTINKALLFVILGFVGIPFLFALFVGVLQYVCK